MCTMTRPLTGDEKVITALKGCDEDEDRCIKRIQGKQISAEESDEENHDKLPTQL